MNFIRKDAFHFFYETKEKWDVILTSPPARPPGFIGQGDASYVSLLGLLMKLARRCLNRGGYFVLVIEEVPGYPVMEPFAPYAKASGMRLLATYRWLHPPTGFSWVVIWGNGRRARLRREYGQEWLIPYTEIDATYGYYEFPAPLVEMILNLTIPKGGSVLDPFCGKATALKLQEPKYTVTGVDCGPVS